MSTLTQKTRELPVGWRWVRLGELCSIQNGFAFDSMMFDAAKGKPLIRIRDLKTNDPSIKFRGPYNETYLVRNGDLLIGMDGEFRAYCWQGQEALLNQRVCRLLPKSDQIDIRFLYFLLDDHLLEIEQATAYTTVKHISSREIEAITLALPPLAEQKRLANFLLDQLAAVEKARAAAYARLEAIEALPAAFLRQVFPKPGQPLPNGWKVLPLGEVGVVVSGVTLGRNLAGQSVREVPYLRVANVKDGYLVLSDVTTTPATPGEIETLKLRQDDLLLTEGGDPDKLGRGSLWEEQLPECIHQNHIFRVRLNTNVVQPAFAAALIGS